MSMDFVGSFVGSVVSVCCGDVLGTYQGQVVNIDQQTQSLTVEKVFRNGIQCTVQNITFNAADIQDLWLIKFKDDPQPEVRLASVSTAPTNTNPGITSAGSTQFSTGNSKVKTQQKTAVGHGGSTNGSAAQGKASHLTTSASGNNSSATRKRQYSRSSPRGGDSGSNNCKARRNSPSQGYRRPPMKTTFPGPDFEEHGYHGNGGGEVVPVKGGRHHLENGGGGQHARASRSRAKAVPQSRNGPRDTSISDCYPVNGSKRTQNRDQRRRTPRDEYFTNLVDTILDEGEFDFEKNLALFNKQAVFEQIENMGYQKVSRSGSRPQDYKYKHDENVLKSKPAVYSQIKVPGTGEIQREFVTDSGLVVPCISYEMRCQLLAAAEMGGYSRERQVETVGRSASEMVLQLIGGSHRLNPKNAHQRPSVVVLCGPHMPGAQGVNCARHLAAHNVQVTLFMPNLAQSPPELQTELRLFDLGEGQRLSSPEDLPSNPVDLIVSALDDHQDHSIQNQAWYQRVGRWTNQNKAHVLAVDPPTGGATIDVKWSLSICLPLSLSEKCGQVYLCDLSIPKKIYSSIGIKYQSPFAHKFLVPLHRS